MSAENPILQEAAEKSRNTWQNEQTEKQQGGARNQKKSLTVPQVVDGGGVESGATGDARDAPSEHFQKKKSKISLCQKTAL